METIGEGEKFDKKKLFFFFRLLLLDLPFSLTDSLSTSTSSQLVHSDVERSSSSEDD